MAKAKIHVWYSSQGKILAVGRALSMPDIHLQITPVTREGNSVLEAEVDEEIIKNLHQTHVVDLGEERLALAQERD